MRYVISFVFFMALAFSGASQSQTFEVVGIDTINSIDRRNQKQGKWIIKGRHDLKKIKAGYPLDQTIETGMYLNNRKEGVWMEYYKNGKERSKLTYVNGVLDGDATFYNTDGKILKEGKFKGNKWVN